MKICVHRLERNQERQQQVADLEYLKNVVLEVRNILLEAMGLLR